ncbi:hypothetical protein [Microbulbifer hydrolyticus]|uniref:Tfp pilus assembly protein PilV n=1 Tax=Microbulbifer hydrolyticus TaxID=48074 RepID=A0A6P1TC54_9GAMM|nr:hypothetical protein [Microbulbifer hydrolyticus]MBB5209883.1 Tfp pilus assembly protein PilV [Microbulbifer hydrolyticus]QHQ39577.1 hypothetical protein GTQ55_11675 [Microbulbifer hydrolyticus]
MLRVIGVLVFALILLGLAGHLFYQRKSENETSHTEAAWMHHLAFNEFKTPVC